MLYTERSRLHHGRAAHYTGNPKACITDQAHTRIRDTRLMGPSSVCLLLLALDAVSRGRTTERTAHLLRVGA
jgi:hypothetical protein